jgi:hypothetical protein
MHLNSARAPNKYRISKNDIAFLRLDYVHGYTAFPGFRGFRLTEGGIGPDDCVGKVIPSEALCRVENVNVH